jgi:hypothetical protein
MADAPVEDDIRHDDLEYDPALEPDKAKAWLNLLEESEDAFEPWNYHCDNLDRIYASLERLASATVNLGRSVGDKAGPEMQLLWSNMEVLKPAIYATAPVPVIVPKFKDRRPVYQQASEVLERTATVAFDVARIDTLMLAVRDDLAMYGRGVPWCRYESGGKGRGYYDAERVCIDFKGRRDFLHSISRCWDEVSWVAAASYMTRSEARERFYRHSGDAYQDADYKVDKDAVEVGGADERERAKFWEIWHKGERRVVWVAQGCEDVLDASDPHLDLWGFFPCPRPAYGTLQPGSLVPVPDAMQYRDQLTEVNLLTTRIHALSNALQAKGFYPAGGDESAEAIALAAKLNDPGRVLIPISNWAAFGSVKEPIIWLPIEQIAETINVLIATRKQIIEDIYQIMGLSDIMRGATDPRETARAQNLKTQFGSSRIRDKQAELVRLARDLNGLVCDIACEKFADTTFIEMSQTQLPTLEMQRRQVMQLQMQMNQTAQQLMQQAQSPQTQQMMNGGPGADPSQGAQQLAQAAQQQLQAMQQHINEVAAQPTIEQVLTFLHDNRARCFTLDIETDSTIVVDEQAQKESHAEFLGVLAQVLPQLIQLVTALPQATDMAGDLLKMAVKPYRVERELGMSIDSFIDATKAQAAQAGLREDPTVSTNRTALQIEQLKQQRQAERDKADITLKAQEMQLHDQRERDKLQSQEKMKIMDLQAKQGDEAAKSQQTNMKAMAEREAHQMDMLGRQADMRLNAQKAQIAAQAAQHKQADMAARQQERQSAQAFRQQQATMRPPQGL